MNGNSGDVVYMDQSYLIINSLFYFNVMNSTVQQTASRGIKFAISAGMGILFGLDVAVGFVPASASGDNIYTVSCYDRSNTLCSKSNYGRSVDVGGPGVEIACLGLSGETNFLCNGADPSAALIAGLLFANSYKQVGTINGDQDGIPDPIWMYAGVLPTPAPVPASNIFQIDIFPDSQSFSQTSYNLTKISPGAPTLLKSIPTRTRSISSTYSWSMVLSSGKYRVDIGDLGGNGILSPGYYTLKFNGALLKTGGSFKYMFFCSHFMKLPGCLCYDM
jgi:hypothetical protein